jgi:hypothetical protein
MLHHDSQELDDDFRARPDHNLSLASLLGIVDGLQGVTQNVHAHHG